MQDLERCALALLSDPAVAGWVQQRLDARLRHVLIDEFQDTSNLQWQALLGWLSSYAGAGGGASGQRPLSVFIVGDPKQSIYRFRGAEPRVFEAARTLRRRRPRGHDLACNHTRRNAPRRGATRSTRCSGRRAADGEFDGFVAAQHRARRRRSRVDVWHAPDPPGDERAGRGAPHRVARLADRAAPRARRSRARRTRRAASRRGVRQLIAPRRGSRAT